MMTSADTVPSSPHSVHSTSLAMLLEQLGSALLVTTYQAGKLVVARERDGVINTHFHNLPAPMGLALSGGRLAVGTISDVREFHDVPAVAAKIEPAGSRDACFLPRCDHVTGNILVPKQA